MKKTLLGFIIGLLISLPAGAFAWSLKQEAKPIVGADCSGPWQEDSNGIPIEDSNHNAIISTTGTDGRCSVNVYSFKDSDNQCYIAKGTGTAISCVKDN